MSKHFFIAALLKRLSLAVVNKMLPSQVVLTNVINDFYKGIVTAVLSAVLFAAAIIMGCYWLYQTLLVLDWTELQAFSLCLTIIFSGAVVSFMMAKLYFARTRNIKTQADFFPDQRKLYFNEVLNSFMEGLKNR